LLVGAEERAAEVEPEAVVLLGPHPPADAVPCLQHDHALAGAGQAPGRGQARVAGSHDADVGVVFHGYLRKGLIRPSWMTDTTKSPSLVKIWPRANPRAPYAAGLSWSESSQSSARNGRWKHMAGSRLAIIVV